MKLMIELKRKSLFEVISVDYFYLMKAKYMQGKNDGCYSPFFQKHFFTGIRMKNNNKIWENPFFANISLYLFSAYTQI